MKKVKLSAPASISKGLRSQFVIAFFFWRTLIALVEARHALCWIDSSFSLNELLKTWSYRTSRESRCGRMKALYMVINIVLGNMLRSLRKRPTALLTLANILLRCSSNINLKSNVPPRWFEKRFERHYYCWKLKVGGSISLICDWNWPTGLACSDQDWNSCSTRKSNH